MCLSWLACTVCRLFLTIFWFPFLLWLALFGARPCLTVGFAFLQPILFPVTISYHTTLSFLLWNCFASIWLDLFKPVVYSSPNGPAWPLVLLLYHWLALVSHLFSLGRPRAHFLSLGFLGPFLNFAFSWAFTEFFGLPWPNYIIPHPWGSWACHQPLTFFVFITLGLSWPILTFPHHILPMICFFSLSGLL